jgi:hypothetical protein
MEGWSTLLKSVAERGRLLWGLALFGAIVFALRRNGYISDLDKSLYYPAVGAGLLGGLMIVTGSVETFSPKISRWIKARAKRRERREYSRHSFKLATPFQKGVLLYYKRNNEKRFTALADAVAFHEIERQGLLEDVTLEPHARRYHYQIPEHVWLYLDNPPDGWTAAAAPFDPRRD